jgi:DNA polymerase-3 subunit gamma/tau
VLQPKEPIEIKKKIESIVAEPASPADKAQPQVEQEVTGHPEDSPTATPGSAPAAPSPVAEVTQVIQSTSSSEKNDDSLESRTLEIHPHERDVRKHWRDFINYVKDRKVWMSQDLQRADGIKQDVKGELHLIYSDPANCSVLRQKENHQLLTEFALDFFQKPLKVRFILPEIDETPDTNGDESPHRKRQQLVNDPLVVMAAEIFNGQVGDIRIGPRSR